MNNTIPEPTSPTSQMTLGEERCHINFNPSADDKIGTFKRMMADAIDFCEEESKLSYTTFKDTPKETDEVAIKYIQHLNETQRCFKIAMEHLETAQMYAVKGIAKGLK